MTETLRLQGAPFAAPRDACLHCGLRVGGGSSGRGRFCCSGCEAVYGLLHGQQLEHFYDLRGGRGVPVPEGRPSRRDTLWLEAIEARVRSSEGPTRIAVDVQGLHCVGCVWLVEQLFGRVAGGERIEVNTALGRVDMIVRPGFDLRAFAASVEPFGYLLGPAIKGEATTSRDLLWRLGVCAAIAMNSMIFAIPLYAGLDRGPVYRLFTTLNLALGVAALGVGGSVFFRSAWRALGHRVLHLDLPIAVGLALAFVGSVRSTLSGSPAAAYFDTLDIFITLMLLGRWLQERAVERNRAWLLASDGVDGILVRRVRDGHVEVVPCAELRSGDAVLVVPGDLVPVDATLCGTGAPFSLDWIEGESRPRAYAAGATVPAGAFSCGDEARTLVAVMGFDQSPLGALLRAPAHTPDAARTSPWFQALSRIYVLGVLGLSALGFVAWWASTGDLSRALSVTTAVLVVTCPCAFGIAAPLAYEMVQVGLRRAGLYVRRASLLDRARDVRRVVFDKTGTLTTGGLVVANPEVLAGLSDDEIQALYDLAARSGHPKSVAVRAALEPRDLALTPNARVVESGGGVELVRQGKRWRLGEPSWVGFANGHASEAPGDLAFGVDGTPLASLRTEERLRPDAIGEVRALLDEGLEVWLLSGDAQSRVDSVAAGAGIPSAHALGGQSPTDKARFLALHDRGDTLFVGDGVNDALALDRAHVSGTPAVDRPYIPARVDFFFVTAGLAPVRLAVRSARALAQVVRADLGIALAYNAVAVGLALAGLMSPLLCAVLMPLSSLLTIGATVLALSPGRPLWRS